jgi:hypothetical protein
VIGPLAGGSAERCGWGRSLAGQQLVGKIDVILGKIIGPLLLEEGCRLVDGRLPWHALTQEDQLVDLIAIDRATARCGREASG